MLSIESRHATYARSHRRRDAMQFRYAGTQAHAAHARTSVFARSPVRFNALRLCANNYISVSAARLRCPVMLQTRLFFRHFVCVCVIGNDCEHLQTTPEARVNGWPNRRSRKHAATLFLIPSRAPHASYVPHVPHARTAYKHIRVQ